jgi:hypothetical protein
MLLLRVDCLIGAIETANKAGDTSTVARMMAELQAVTKAHRELVERGRAQ